MKNRILFILLLISGLGFTECRKASKQAMEPEKTCDKVLKLTEGDFPETETRYTIKDPVLKGNCLEMTIGASGCSLNLEDVELQARYSPNAIYPAVGTPVKVPLKIVLKSLGGCAAVMIKRVSFDLMPLQMRGGAIMNLGAYTLLLEQWDTPISYTFNTSAR